MATATKEITMAARTKRCTHEAAKRDKDYLCRECGKFMIDTSKLRDSGGMIDGSVSR